MTKQEHPYAEILRAIADGEDIQYQDGEWFDVSHTDTLCFIHTETLQPKEMRVKPQTIGINDIDVPIPVRNAPIKGSTYYVPSFRAERVEQLLWWNDEIDKMYLQRGFVHDTAEAAKCHALALMSFTVLKD